MATRSSLTRNAAYWKLVGQIVERVTEQQVNEQDRRKSEGLNPLSATAERELTKHLINQDVRKVSVQLVQQGRPQPSAEQEDALVTDVYNEMYRGGRLQALLDNDDLEGIEVNGCDTVFVRYEDGHREQVDPVAESDERLIQNVRRLATYHGLNPRDWNASNWQLDLRLQDGHRLSAVMGVTDRPIINIRRHRLVKVTLADLVDRKMLSPELADFLTAVVRAKKNVVVGGETGAGKTTLLRALINEIDPRERVITIENALELGIAKLSDLHPNAADLEARLANQEGSGEISMGELVRRTLRMDPDRVIVGEVLGPEIVDMLSAMSQGNDGSLSTIHSRTARDVITRMVLYARQPPERMDPETSRMLIAGAVDFIVFIRRTTAIRGATPRRFIESVLEVGEYDREIGVMTSEVWRPGADGAAVRADEVPIRCAAELEAVGYIPDGAPL